MEAPIRALRLVLGDQLSTSLASLRGSDPGHDVILMCEVKAEATYVRHHKKKIAFLFSAMRHFAAQLKADGHRVRYIELNDPQNSGGFDGEVRRAIAELSPHKLVLTQPGEYRVLEIFHSWQAHLGVPVEICEDDRFLSSIPDFTTWAKGKKQLRLEFFYREMRKRYGTLMEADGQPTGGEWNYDKDNRKPPKSGMRFPVRPDRGVDQITQDVLDLVADSFPEHFGDLLPFDFAVTRESALAELRYFLSDLLPYFGDFQDAMVMGEAFLYHSHISAYLNSGLLLPLEACQLAEEAYRIGTAPLNAVEGFIRQILGWREYVRGIYWMHMPTYADRNTFSAREALPSFYWDGHTQMACVREAVEHTRRHAYSHHIQRLMVTGNFALLAGIAPAEVCDWYLQVYADAYEWVELPNTLGMALFADDGIMASKPYAASGKYIHRMSNYCQSCKYKPDVTVGELACPFNSLYWDFMARNSDALRSNQRLSFVFPTWDKMGTARQQAIRQQAATYLAAMKEGEL